MHHREEADRPSSLGALEPSRAAWSCPRSSRFEDVRQRQGPGDCLDREQIANQRFSAEERAFGRPWPCKSRIADAPEVAFEDDPFLRTVRGASTPSHSARCIPKWPSKARAVTDLGGSKMMSFRNKFMCLAGRARAARRWAPGARRAPLDHLRRWSAPAAHRRWRM